MRVLCTSWGQRLYLIAMKIAPAQLKEDEYIYYMGHRVDNAATKVVPNIVEREVLMSNMGILIMFQPGWIYSLECQGMILTRHGENTVTV